MSQAESPPQAVHVSIDEGSNAQVGGTSNVSLPLPILITPLEAVRVSFAPFRTSMVGFYERIPANWLSRSKDGYSSPTPSPEDTRLWRPTWFQPQVFAGMASLIVSVLAMLASLLVLLISNQQPVKSWKIQPTVYLAIASAIAAISLRFAKTRAAPISWWHHTLMGSKIRDLESHWEASQSFFGAVAGLRTATGMSLATCFVA